jgi:hypothetical protein
MPKMGRSFTMLNTIAYLYTVLFAIISLVVAVNIFRDRSGSINLVVNSEWIPNECNFTDESYGDFIWSPTFGCFFGGNDNFIAKTGGGFSGYIPRCLTRYILVSDQMDIGVQMAILAHERGHDHYQHMVVGGLKGFWNEVLADQKACHEIGRFNYISLMGGHFNDLLRDITFESQDKRYEAIGNLKLRIFFCYLMP